MEPTGPIAPGDPCPALPAPPAPQVESPTAEALTAIEALVLRTTGAPGVVGEASARARFELWSVKGQGGLGARVWSATVEAPGKLNEVRLADGHFDVVGARLAERKRYAVRVLHGLVRPGCGEVWGEWSEPRFFRTDDASGELFDETKLLEFHLDIPPESWAALNAEAVPPDCVPHERESYRATLRFRDQVFEGVGLQVKGGCGSARTLEGKASFKVDLEWDDPEVAACPASRELLGRKKLTFNNTLQDPSFMNERLGYPLYRALGVPAPRSATVKLFVNGQPWGLYTHVETFDRRFLWRWFEDKDGVLYEGSYWCDLLPGNVPAAGASAQGFCLERKLDGGDCGERGDGEAADAFAPLRELTLRLQALPRGGFYPEVTAFFDYDRFLTMWAADSLLSHWDGYLFENINNYRVYQDPATGRWTLLPGGIDQTFGHREGSRSGLRSPWEVSGLLARRCLEEADCQAAFAARLAQVTRVFEEAGLDARVQRTRSQLAADVYADPRKETSNGEFEQAVRETLEFIHTRPTRIREYLEQGP
ncbi:CotH kinase family protein [Pyxidicoccus sp. 3LG]